MRTSATALKLKANKATLFNCVEASLAEADKKGRLAFHEEAEFAHHRGAAIIRDVLTKDITSGKSETVTVPKAGDGAYFCRYHPGMKGRLVLTRGN